MNALFLLLLLTVASPLAAQAEQSPCVSDECIKEFVFSNHTDLIAIYIHYTGAGDGLDDRYDLDGQPFSLAYERIKAAYGAERRFACERDSNYVAADVFDCRLIFSRGNFDTYWWFSFRFQVFLDSDSQLKMLKNSVEIKEHMD